MRKQLTGEPVAGEPHTGFGGRGQRSPFPTPIPWPTSAVDANGKSRHQAEVTFTTKRPSKAAIADSRNGFRDREHNRGNELAASNHAATSEHAIRRLLYTSHESRNRAWCCENLKLRREDHGRWSGRDRGCSRPHFHIGSHPSTHDAKSVVAAGAVRSNPSKREISCRQQQRHGH
jgi:hypothetical protein